MIMDALPAFILASVVIELTPGPNMVYLAILSAQRGRLAGLAAVAGVALGLLSVGLLAAFGVATLVQDNRWLYQILRWSGVVYLLWLAWDAWQDAQRPAQEDGLEQPFREFFRRGLITNLLNPKAAVFYIAVLPAFVDTAAALLPQTLTLTLVYVGVATGIHAGIALAAGTLKPFLADPRRRRMMGAVFAGLLVLVAIWVGLKTAP